MKAKIVNVHENQNAFLIIPPYILSCIITRLLQKMQIRLLNSNLSTKSPALKTRIYNENVSGEDCANATGISQGLPAARECGTHSPPVSYERQTTKEDLPLLLRGCQPSEEKYGCLKIIKNIEQNINIKYIFTTY